ncbi:Myosin heavy chain kinase B [Nosema bombycis CQ1]|uniref:Myosin heavy chain kinase B n=1 Tax=Nosema bombycis (strain CQ1 / CVCC 102059) TaxID=578461 RepID=R0MCF5_NOSB1|nr:Myosin heavy chain kinase B [Nosema bombycis CQ1]|eukprot:EOB11730.1 Myosin heavy chain kinase B [Nosema bombycis CQ1]
MINCIGFLPKGINVEKLNKFEKDEEIIKKLEHLELPIIENDYENEESDTNECIVESDLIVYSSLNNRDLSYFQFHVYDEEMDDFVIHHDIYVFSSINDTEYLNFNNKHYVALATFENNIMVYDALVKNPMTPQILLEGHGGPVMSITKNDTFMYSGSEDLSFITWDLEKLCLVKKTPLEYIPEKLCLTENKSVIIGSKDKVHVFNAEDEIKLEGTVHNLVANGDNFYISDSSGALSIYDVRNPSVPKTHIKVSEQPLTGLDVLENVVAVSSLDGHINVFDTNNLQVKFSHKIKNEIHSVKLSEENVLFLGTEMII